MVDITFIVPVGPHHKQLAQRAIASVHAQTVPCAVIAIEDTDARGPGWARNQGLTQVVTPFVAFLDADDTIAPNWAAQALAAMPERGYVYTDWWEDSHIVHAPECPWVVLDKGVRTFHVITALLRTADVHTIGGFNETLPGAEDTDFYRRLVLDNGVCGVRVPYPLFYYGGEGERSKALHANATMHRKIVSGLDDRWRGKMSSCAKCGGAHSPAIAVEPSEALQAGYVWVTAEWDGNRRERGIATGNVYPKSGNGKLMQVDALDQQAEPDKFALWVDRSYERRDEPQPDDLERIDVQEFSDLGDLFRALTGASEPPPPAYDPYAGQAATAGKQRDLSKVWTKLERMLG